MLQQGAFALVVSMLLEDLNQVLEACSLALDCPVAVSVSNKVECGCDASCVAVGVGEGGQEMQKTYGLLSDLGHMALVWMVNLYVFMP